MLKFYSTNYSDILSVFSDSGIIFALWKKSTTNKDFINICEKMHEITMHNKLSLFLGDVRDMGIRDQDTLEWLDKYWFPNMKKAGITKVAIVISDSIEARFGVSSWGSMITKAGMEIDYFEDIEIAKQWLVKAFATN